MQQGRNKDGSDNNQFTMVLVRVEKPAINGEEDQDLDVDVEAAGPEGGIDVTLKTGLVQLLGQAGFKTAIVRGDDGRLVSLENLSAQFTIPTTCVYDRNKQKMRDAVDKSHERLNQKLREDTWRFWYRHKVRLNQNRFMD